MVKFGTEPFLECSSSGDSRFSAFYARVNGTTIERIYQAAKIFEGNVTNLHWRKAKGKKPINIKEVRKLYSHLWAQYLNEHPELHDTISQYSGFSDIYGKAGHACQAEEVYKYSIFLKHFS